MKKITNILLTLVLMMAAFSFASCANESSESTSESSESSESSSSSSTSTAAISGTYKGTFVDDGTTYYFIVYIKSDYTWYSLGYGTDSTYTTESDVGTISENAGATYTRSGNTLSMKAPFESGYMEETATTTDNWQTVTLSGTFEGKVIKQ